MPLSPVSKDDVKFLEYAIEVAIQAEHNGNLPIGAVIVLNGEIIAEGQNNIFIPTLNSYGHAELNAIKNVEQELLFTHAKEMTLYTNIEPCIMCLGAAILHRIGRVVYGGTDPNKGAVYLISSLNKIYSKEQMPVFVGPVLQEKCLPMWERANELYRERRGE